jgi:hypothetical protein
MKVIASAAKQSRPLDTVRLPRRSAQYWAELLAMTKCRFTNSESIMLEASFALGYFNDGKKGRLGLIVSVKQ